MMSYKTVRQLYYLGIAILVLYALPNVPFITKYLYPLLVYQILPGFQAIAIIAILVGVGAFLGYKYRRIG